ncbi:MAG: sensor domain-containing diguanylate cyclase [Betaproteobacteria bacterium]
MESTFFPDFEVAAKAALAFLHQRLGFDLWMITRTEGEDWIVLQTEDHGYDIAPGKVFRWADTLCSRMVDGHGPRVAPNVGAVAAYADAPLGHQLTIGSYVGVPLVRDDGGLFGTLCAMHPAPRPDSIVDEQGLVELLGAMLSTILQYEIRMAETSRRAERAEADSQTDAMTGLYNRAGWNRLLALEENRCRRYGHPAVVLMLGLDALKLINHTQGHEAGDALILRAAGELRDAARTADVVARLAGDEFAVLGVECDRAGGEALVARVRTALSNGDIEGSVGLAARDPMYGLASACEEADRLMHLEKRSS